MRKLATFATLISFQLLIGCDVSQPDPCKQITAITKEYKEIKESTVSKTQETSSEQLFEKSKKIGKLQLSDPALKALQQKLVSNYDNWAKSTHSIAVAVKRQENPSDDPASIANFNKQIDISNQINENSKKNSDALQENIKLTDELKKICSS